LTSACGLMGGNSGSSGASATPPAAASGGSTSRCEGLTGQALERCRAQAVILDRGSSAGGPSQ
jgi:hypothetical protein